MFRVDLKNVGIIREAHLSFVPGVNLILGASSSGKSTLLRALRGLADNSFTDAMVTHGKGMMQIDVDTGDAHVTYTRDTKARDRKACYVVNGEEYTKLGRQQLDVVADTLKVSSVKIDTESVNFNFSSQFAGPFLLLGSPSTLYSVLTYHESFDVTRLDDLYKGDVKELSDQIKVSQKVIEQLSTDVEKADNEVSRLSKVPDIYASVMQFKAKRERVESLRRILNRLDEVRNEHMQCIKRLNQIASVYNLLTNMILKMQNIHLIGKLISMYDSCADAKRKISLSDSISNYDTKRLSALMRKQYKLSSLVSVYDKKKALEDNIHRSDAIMNFDMEKVSGKLSLSRNLMKVISLHATIRDYVIRMGNFPDLKERYDIIEKCLAYITFCSEKQKIVLSLMELENDMVLIQDKMDAFGFCPLCGQPLSGHVLHDAEL